MANGYDYFKPKRFAIEMCNEFAKKFAEMGDTERSKKVDYKLRNAYVCGIITEIELMKTITEMYDEICWKSNETKSGT